ncbi:hypothetical protein [Serratia fonticola]|uniref:hypothetical protein n=1 Tax=Serratia fonticola TaxID=47917 RepID=UPI0013764F85|nr:hypothetical protein [Serratia fonticola]MBC3220891.1 hypothetical protein [Serratia fonticola]NBJ32163.1 hypothetical protein [Serratia fonticola]
MIVETNSNLSLAASRFSSDGYLDFMTAMESRDAVTRGDSPESVSRAKIVSPSRQDRGWLKAGGS